MISILTVDLSTNLKQNLMNAPNSDTQPPSKPLPLRIVFILNALMMILPFIFYAVITQKNVEIDGLNPTWMLYTGAGYILSFMALVYFILKRNITGVRAIIILNVLVSLPAKAYIGIGVAVISFALTFVTKVKKSFLIS